MDRMTFERVVASHADCDVECIVPVINGQRLDDVWSRLATDRVAPLSVAEIRTGIWATEGATDEFLVADDGRVAVLTCTCGFFGCGGAAARIGIEDDVIRWTDFATYDAERLVDVTLGAFTFDRAAYLDSLETALDGTH
jgi:hypothetical protein